MNVIEPEIIIYFVLVISWYIYDRINYLRTIRDKKLLPFLTEVEILRIGFAVDAVGAKEGLYELNNIIGENLYFTEQEKCKIIGACYNLYKKTNSINN